MAKIGSKLNKEKPYIVMDVDGTMYPLQDPIHPCQFMTYHSAHTYAKHLAQLHPAKQYEVWVLRPDIAFITESKCTRLVADSTGQFIRRNDS